MSTTEATSSDAVSTWEQVYHDAWRHFHASIEEILNRLTLENRSPEDLQVTIEKMSRLTVELDNIRSAAQDMFEHVPGCSTVRQRPVTYFVDEFVHKCNYINYKLNMMSWRLMNRTNSERAVHNRLSKLLESLRDQIPEESV
ncbi:hypothetical protein N7489_006572 [Penicillium chrysogenum]|jgi:hypothetical protein|uniref:Uncharacterized protein n=1 Tax=Penicillium chrysogenum TaxID=5076 RepID=A0ABQ8W3Y4_PENCH|nr:uncharacterized protein N7489_006572 [Penicillium chrysogenum]KAJ5236481.1 hypothetical protein N7489_006572 [Penicillium chrysogenum]KAJ5255385.1 hypothetical protein N7505_010536 [Penicillium chrysogenum]KAJ5276423.1 hypothetical protein N7524_002576 [Penicillium chrysogenum]KAJ6152811.1 hypothetical protein N7497_007130 [Penicillium chrysogenum]